jgi:hypothetical protein
MRCRCLHAGFGDDNFLLGAKRRSGDSGPNVQFNRLGIQQGHVHDSQLPSWLQPAEQYLRRRQLHRWFD